MDSEFPSNSHSAKDKADEPKALPKKDIKQLVDAGVAKKVKPSLGKRFKDTFWGGEDAKSVFTHFALEVLYPSARDMVVDNVINAVETVAYRGNARPPSAAARRSSGFRPQHTPYQQMHGGPASRQQAGPGMSPRSRATHDFGSMILPTRLLADEVLGSMLYQIEQFQLVTVADLYQMVGEIGTFIDDRWGWTNLDGASVRRASGGGYILNLPPPVQIS